MILKPRLFRKPNLRHILMPDAGLWLFNEGSGNIVFDLSENGHIGTIINATWTAGKFGSALSLDGTGDYVNLPNFTPAIDGSYSFTFIIWVNPSSIASDQGIFAQRTSGSNGFVLAIDGGTGDLKFYDNAGWQTASTSSISVGQWWQVALVYNSSGSITYYINGVNAGGDSSVNTDFFGGVPSTDASIGAWDTGSNSFSGQLDIPSFYNRALSASEIAELYLRPFAMFDRTPIELWVGATSVGVPVANAPTSTIYGPLVGCLGGPI